MIGYLRGELAFIKEGEILIDVQGVGYKVFISAMTLAWLPPVGSEIKVYTYLQLREDGVSLFGFPDQDALSLFERLITVNGVGPKAALSLLGTMSANDLKFALLSEDTKSISRAPGIGAKTAQRIIMELKDKVSLEESFAERTEQVRDLNRSSAASDAIQGLVALGYSASDAMKAVQNVPGAEGLNAEEILKNALKQLY